MGSKLHLPPCRKVIAELLADGAVHRVPDINRHCMNYATNTVRNVLVLMTEEGTIENVGRGQYRLSAEKEVSRG